jgi:hypothetical protein
MHGASIAAIIRGTWSAIGKHLLAALINEDSSPTASARILSACFVSEDSDPLRHL